jgi:hypothetical protein
MLEGLVADPAKLATKDNLDAALNGVKGLLKPAGETTNVPEEITAFRKAFDDLLEKVGVDQLVVLIDDLDRCLPDTAIETLEAVRLLVFPRQHQGRTGLKYPFVKVSDMNLPENQRAITTAQNWVNDDDVRELRLKIYPVGTIIFPKIGGAIATNKRRFLSLPATFDNNVMGLIPSDKLISDYLFAFMQSFDLTELQAGTSVPAISQRKVEAMRIPERR